MKKIIIVLLISLAFGQNIANKKTELLARYNIVIESINKTQQQLAQLQIEKVQIEHTYQTLTELENEEPDSVVVE